MRAARHELPAAWRDRLRAVKVKATPNRLRVLGRFLESDGPWTLRSLYDALKGSGRCDQSSVYRALSDLRAAGFLEEFRLPGRRETYYSLLGQGGQGGARKGVGARPRPGHHHHHIVCEDCGRVSHLEMCLPPGLTSKVEEASGFRVTAHHLEFQGLCGDCGR